MHLSRSFQVVAILAGVLSHVMGALAQEQIIDDLDALTTIVNIANSDANALTATTADSNIQV